MPREWPVRFIDQEKYFVSEASIYRLLKAHDLITSPAFIVVKAAETFTEQTTAPNAPTMGRMGRGERPNFGGYCAHVRRFKSGTRFDLCRTSGHLRA